MGNLHLTWDPNETPEGINDALHTLAEEYPIASDAEGIKLQFKPGEAGKISIEMLAGRAVVRYGRTCEALRAVGTLLAGLVEAGQPVHEVSPFKTTGIMLDCSRNAVMTVTHFKRWLRQLALLGYNMAMLYTEDTYEIPGHEYFGYMRGPYTAAELKEIDQYAATLGIEMIACIQTLGHLEQILRWPVYNNVKDTSSVLMVGAEETYELIEGMVKVFKEAFGSRRIHIGMDEAHDLGRGRYMDENGYRRGFDIFNEHLERVIAICKRQDLDPIIWSDMYFRMGAPNMKYRHPDTVIPDDVVAAIPKDIQMVYWDYFKEDKSFYLDWIQRHRDLGFEPLMGSAVWSWLMPWHGTERTEKRAGPCIEACLEAGVDEIFFTMWGDDGGFCDFDSVLTGLAFTAEKIHTPGVIKEEALSKRFAAISGASYEANRLAGDVNFENKSVSMLWDDPLLGIHHHLLRTDETQVNWLAMRDHYAQLEQKLAPHDLDEGAVGGGDISHIRIFLKTLSAKMTIRDRLMKAYAKQDKQELSAIIDEIDPLCGLLQDLAQSWRKQWMSCNKPFGFEVLQIRLGGLIMRHQELKQRLEEYLAGLIDTIAELDVKPETVMPNIDNQYRTVATGTTIR